jgi:DNA-binding MarR family transcriptional regulator
LPPSAKLVFKVLESGSLLTQKDIIAKTYLPARTVRYALTRLKKENLLLKRFYFQDARQSLYGLNAQALGVVTA